MHWTACLNWHGFSPYYGSSIVSSAMRGQHGAAFIGHSLAHCEAYALLWEEQFFGSCSLDDLCRLPPVLHLSAQSKRYGSHALCLGLNVAEYEAKMSMQNNQG